jgi:WD40 repeat protein
MQVSISPVDKPGLCAGHASIIRSLAFSPDGGRLASACWDHTVKLWDPSTGQEVLILRGDCLFSGIAFSANGQHLAAGCKERILVWSATR